MLINPAAIVAFLLYLVVGPLTIPQRFQTRFKSLGYGVHQKISSVFSLSRGPLEPQDYPVAFVATIVDASPATPVETNVVHPLPSCPVPLEERVEVVIQEVCPTRYDNHPSLATAHVFVVFPEYQGPFHWRDLFNFQVLNVLTAIYISVWFPLVVVPFILKLLSQPKPLDEQAVDTQPIRLPTKILTPPRTVNIRISNPKPYAPLEPIFSPPPPESSTFWLAREYPLTLFHSHHELTA